ncbi:NAD(P)-dependent oxidoreductase [Rhodospirillum rubrum]|uniref:SDR family oxidoreductase n=1 Tax=Rhodospirillum rubrum TaxID=1085 RepID=UPI001905C9BD|nr:SDR family oxidoreductase [Rhodospirillum rubrum]MBK1663272.1 NAD(P)-dependent oxidoreductase [Rhodospirillum rubrum]MBK1677072.1 NAD(P)-dependent oxidoreductase [Rhodospirillum rubrum]
MSDDVLQPPQQQDSQPGHELEMTPQPDCQPRHPGSNRLAGKVALISGGDSGIGRAVALAFAREGARVALLYLDEHDDARETERLVMAEGSECLVMPGDVGDEAICIDAVAQVVGNFGGLDILVNNAAEQHEVEDLSELTAGQLEKTFRTNVFGCIYLAKAALPHLPKGGSIINTTSITAYQGHRTLIDYSATKGAIVALTRSLSQSLLDRGIRVNAVAPGPIWTPLIPATFSPDHVASHGASVPMGRAGQPNEVAPAYVFLASDDASYISGQVIHPNGGAIIGS